ncbi:hypothetical protein [Quadrisphaera sp. DSM 44207]|uniref:hypothetical protein n=1 Tax=Quadrisphaera sp. DSM 44207 TaxID=1881057 RepID=UPI000886837D|nr:hypothetical protein [Quadrisphaera sp. DSM 44207]SDQ67135.1 hypothetical protein SAMN05428996_2323 [Quadrisphaera sp. DSM 44207]
MPERGAGAGPSRAELLRWAAWLGLGAVVCASLPASSDPWASGIPDSAGDAQDAQGVRDGGPGLWRSGFYRGANTSPDRYDDYQRAQQWRASGNPATRLTAVREFLPSDLGWDGIRATGSAGVHTTLVNLTRYVEDDPRTVVSLAVPLFPADRSLATLAGGRRGQYAHHFTRLAKALVDVGLAGSVDVCLGWEMNSSSSVPWALNGDPTGQNPAYSAGNPEEGCAQYVAQWNSAADALKSVDSRISTCHNPISGWDGTGPDPELMVPAEECVDRYGIDHYDVDFTGRYPADGVEDWLESWRARYEGAFGVRYWEERARRERKGFCVPEHGVFRYGSYDSSFDFVEASPQRGGGDNPHFFPLLNARLAAMAAAGTDVYDCQFNYNERSAACLLTGFGGAAQRNREENALFPRAASAYRSLRWGSA